MFHLLNTICWTITLELFTVFENSLYITACKTGSSFSSSCTADRNVTSNAIYGSRVTQLNGLNSTVLMSADIGNNMVTSKTESSYSADFWADRDIIARANHRFSLSFNSIESNSATSVVGQHRKQQGGPVSQKWIPLYCCIIHTVLWWNATWRQT